MSLRPAATDDLAAVMALWTRPEYAMFLPAPEPGEADARFAEGLLWLWDRDNGLAGFAGLTVWNGTDGIWGLTHFAIARPGRGDGKRFLAAILTETFGRHGIHRLSVDSVPDNTAALGLWRRAGFKPEGRFRQCWRRPDGVWADSLVFGLLAHEHDPAVLD